MNPWNPRYRDKLNTIDRMTRYVAVLPLVPLRVGDGFSVSAWPLHVTIVPTFESDLAATEVGERLAEAASGAQVIDAIVGGDDLFGSRANVPVALIEPSPDLTVLHRRMLARMLAVGAIFDSPDYIGDGYRPHVSVTKRARPGAGDRIQLAQLALVDMQPVGEKGHRRVVWTADLGRPR